MIDARFTIEPVCCFFIWLTAKRDIIIVPLRLILTTQSHVCSKSHSGGAYLGVTPALFTNTSIPPICFTVSATRDSHSALEETSPLNAMASPPCRTIKSATRWAASIFKSETTTLAPSLLKRRAIASPSPDPPPVMWAILPSSLPAIWGLHTSFWIPGVPVWINFRWLLLKQWIWSRF